MHELDGHRALADRGSDAFDRVGSHVAGRETPARLVSSRNGCRLPVQCGDCASDGPVLMNPLPSRSISGGSQSVRGTAPMKLNTAGVSTVRFSPVLLLTISMELRWPSPFIRCTVELRSSSMLGVCSIRLAR